ncbi:hypothetical protein BH24BAC1_BH24BAC1_10720 [soil metagenome]
MTYFSLPFSPLQGPGKKFGKVDEEESVRQHIQLLLATMPGSYRFSPLYGSWLNKHHYRLPDKRRGERRLEEELREKLQRNLRLLLPKYEPRFALHDMEVNVRFPKAGEILPFEKGGRITFEINLIGSINGKEAVQFSEEIFLK